MCLKGGRKRWQVLIFKVAKLIGKVWDKWNAATQWSETFLASDIMIWPRHWLTLRILTFVLRVTLRYNSGIVLTLTSTTLNLTFSSILLICICHHINFPFSIYTLWRRSQRHFSRRLSALFHDLQFDLSPKVRQWQMLLRRVKLRRCCDISRTPTRPIPQFETKLYLTSDESMSKSSWSDLYVLNRIWSYFLASPPGCVTHLLD